jgi:hypothetical protein
MQDTSTHQRVHRPAYRQDIRKATKKLRKNNASPFSYQDAYSGVFSNA